MGILAGPFVGAAVLLALGGLLKARRPRAAARALERAGLGALAPLARLLGVAELAAAVAALAVGARWTAAVVAAFYAGFSAFTARNLARGNEQGGGGCGCFGEPEAPPTPLHLVVNLAATAVAGAVAAGSGGGLAEALRGQPLAGVPFLLLVAVCTGLAYAAMSVLPETIASMARTQP